MYLRVKLSRVVVPESNPSSDIVKDVTYHHLECNHNILNILTPHETAPPFRHRPPITKPFAMPPNTNHNRANLGDIAITAFETQTLSRARLVVRRRGRGTPLQEGCSPDAAHQVYPFLPLRPVDFGGRRDQRPQMTHHPAAEDDIGIYETERLSFNDNGVL